MNLLELSPLLLALVSCIVASLGTTFGAGFIFVLPNFSRKLEVGLLAAASGVMLAACFFSLIEPAIADKSISSLILCTGGILFGAFSIWFIHENVPHQHFIMGQQGPNSKSQQMWLFVFAITLHNFPEGMATTVAFAGDEPMKGLAMATGILIQNIPEGLAVAGALRIAGHTTISAFLISSLSGLVEVLGGSFGLGLGLFSVWLLPAVLGVAAGAMLFVIVHEILPETYNDDHHAIASFSIIGGIILMVLFNIIIV